MSDYAGIEQAFEAQIRSIQVDFIFYTTLVFMPIGVLLNGFTILVFLRPKMRSTSMALYNISLASVNLLVIVIQSAQMLPVSIGQDLSLKSDLACKLVSYLPKIFIQLASWLQVGISADRMVTIVSFKHHFDFLRSKRNVLTIFLVITVALLTGNSASLMLTVQFTNATNSGLAVDSYECKGTVVVMVLRDILSTLLRTVIPFVLLLAENLYVLYWIRVTKSKIHTRSSDTIASHKPKKETHLLRSIIALNVLFFVTNFPAFLATVAANLYEYVLPGGNKHTLVILDLFQYIALQVGVLHHVLIFFIDLSFNKIFQKEVYKILEELKLFVRSKRNSKLKIGSQIHH